MDCIAVPECPEVFVSRDGRVFRIRDGNKPFEYSLWNDRDGYKNVTVKRVVNGKTEKRNFKIHRLVYQAFVGRLIDGLVICHLDGSKDKNTPSNLIQDTMAVNHSHKRAHGTNLSGEASPAAKHTADEIISVARSIQSASRDAIGRLWRGEIDRICKLHGVKRSTVRHLIHGEAWGDTLADANIEFPAITREIRRETAHS